MIGRRPVEHQVICGSAERRFPGQLGSCSAIVTDPPYYDFIAYSDLSLLHRCWFERNAGERLAGAPIYPLGGGGSADFARRLGRALRNAARAVEADGVVAFTYHSAHANAWHALSEAVAAADLTVTAVFPVWADARSRVAHGHPGSCEWDLVWVCRPGVQRTDLVATVDAWDLKAIAPADRVNLTLGLAAAYRANTKGKMAAPAPFASLP
jgi:adenine-specific DNA methylase